DMRALLQRKAEDWDAVIEGGGAHLQAGLIEQQAPFNPATIVLGAKKALPASEFGNSQALSCLDFLCLYNEVAIIACHEVPGISAQLGVNGIDEAWQSEQSHHLVATEKKAQQVIETREMIHVPVGDEDVTYAQQLTRG